MKSLHAASSFTFHRYWSSVLTKSIALRCTTAGSVIPGPSAKGADILRVARGSLSSSDGRTGLHRRWSKSTHEALLCGSTSLNLLDPRGSSPFPRRTPSSCGTCRSLSRRLGIRRAAGLAGCPCPSSARASGSSRGSMQTLQYHSLLRQQSVAHPRHRPLARDHRHNSPRDKIMRTEIGVCIANISLTSGCLLLRDFTGILPCGAVRPLLPAGRRPSSL